VVELVVWGKDVLAMGYLGEVALPLYDWFREEGSALGFDDPGNQVG
jgi:phosphatidylserine decarboxylase